jgi:hypothetical protein
VTFEFRYTTSPNCAPIRLWPIEID